MARHFPDIATYGSAFRFALEAEQACADLAAAAQVLAPDEAWRDKLDAVICTHADRVTPLTLKRQEAGDTMREPVDTLDGSAYMGQLEKDPATSWPAVVEQLIRAEADAARYHADFVAQCGKLPAAEARAFAKSAEQDRAVAAELRQLLG